MDIKLLSKVLGRDFTSEPDYYGFLGLDRFEVDTTKVIAAKRDLLKKVEVWQSHADPEILRVVQEILDIASKAETTLTDLRLKAAYDAALNLPRTDTGTIIPQATARKDAAATGDGAAPAYPKCKVIKFCVVGRRNDARVIYWGRLFVYSIVAGVCCGGTFEYLRYLVEQSWSAASILRMIGLIGAGVATILLVDGLMKPIENLDEYVPPEE